MDWNCLAFSLTFLLGIGFAGAAHADLTPPEVSACASLAVGSPCNNNGPGTCQYAACTQSSAGPSWTPYPALCCVATGTGKDSGSDGNKDSSGCAIGGNLAGTVGPWMVAGLFGSGVMLARRRRRH